MTVPKGYVGHERDLAKGKCVRDPDVRFTGPKGSTRVFLRSDGIYAVTRDLGPDAGALRYALIEPHIVLKEAIDVAKCHAGLA